MLLRYMPPVLITVCAISAHPATICCNADPGDTITLQPNDVRLDAQRLVPHRVTWRVTVHDSSGGVTVQGLWTDVWVHSDEGGLAVAVFRQLFVDTTGAILVDNETVFDAMSLRAIRSNQGLPPSGSRVTYHYDGDRVTGTLWTGTDAEPRNFEIAFDQPVWDPLAPVLDLFPLERLEPGTVIRYPIWNQSTSGEDVTWNTVRVDSVGRGASPAGPNMRTWNVTLRTVALPNVVMYIRRTPEPPYVPWLRVERPGLTREWTLVDWEPLGKARGERGSAAK